MVSSNIDNFGTPQRRMPRTAPPTHRTDHRSWAFYSALAELALAIS
ncbi:hypothetical protein ABT127_30370 [Streptomyces sp. NPDC001904]